MLPCQAVSRAGARACPGLPREAASSLVPAPAHAYRNAQAGRRVHLPSSSCWLTMAVRRQGGRLTGPRCAGGQRGAGRVRLGAWCGARIHDRGGDLLSSCSSVRLSGGDLVLVRESAEDLFPSDPVLGEVDLQRPGVSLGRCDLVGLEYVVGPVTWAFS